jgi:L-2,4-diaminobutyrate decarboxylase
MGHQVPPALPAAALFDLLGRAANQGAAVFEMAPFGTAAEKAVIQELGALIGWQPGNFAGIGTHGGTLANVTALLAARNLRYQNVWQEGMTSADTKPAILTSADSHYCIARACGILGIGTSQLLKVPVDGKRRMNIAEARRTIQRARDNGMDPFAIVGSACTTPTGSFDDLAGIGELAREAGLWFHVDGAHGASFLFSQKHRHLLNGIEQADSVAWDAHKMLFVPALCTYLIYKKREHSWAPFAQDAPYLFDPADPSGMAEYDGGLRTFECTKGAISLGLWGIWSLYGRDFITSLIDGVTERTKRFHQMITDAPDFEAAHAPQCNILCFRYVPRGQEHGVEAMSALQQKIRARLLRDGKWYITGTRIDGTYWLRVTIINPLTGEKHLAGLLDAIRECMLAAAEGEGAK